MIEISSLRVGVVLLPLPPVPPLSPYRTHLGLVALSPGLDLRSGLDLLHSGLDHRPCLRPDYTKFSSIPLNRTPLGFVIPGLPAALPAAVPFVLLLLCCVVVLQAQFFFFLLTFPGWLKLSRASVHAF